ncbi:hypothetical protein PENSPDRAFT_595041 [Peniophora sp. CONT]|nr:hypothetical protein PENSPDRAFT_595041 [Peniophora sp. CONT]
MAHKANTPEEDDEIVERVAGRAKPDTNSGRPKPEPEAERSLRCYVNVNGLKCLALFDSGSTTTCIAPAVADVAKIRTFPLNNPVTLQLGCVGSRSKINYGATTRISVGSLVNEDVYVDLVNLDKYDMVLGTPFMNKYKCVLDFENGGVRINGQWVPSLIGGEDGEPKKTVNTRHRASTPKMTVGNKDARRAATRGAPQDARQGLN